MLHHDLSYAPHPFLGRHIELAAEDDPALARRALEACSIAPGQRRTGRRTLERLQAAELKKQIGNGDFRGVAELRGEWLPGEGTDRAAFLAVRQVARYLVAAEMATVPRHRLGHLDRARGGLDGLSSQLLADRSAFAAAFRPAIAPWNEAVAALRQSAEEQATGQVPNPFRAGEPLTPEHGAEVFRGREALVRALEELLADPDHSASIALLAPRRCGKTSLLRMLPKLLPDAVCVFFDLQDNPLDTPAHFFQALARRTREAGLRHGRLELPALPDGAPFAAGRAWLEDLEGALGEARLLICLDEFERLEDLFPGTRRELLQLMGLFRATIQHGRRVRLLVAGEAPFDELDAMWNDHFINLRELRAGHLDPATARQLVLRPSADFPPGTIPDAVADRIVEESGGQPFLVQLYAYQLVVRLNAEGRRVATAADLDPVREEVLTQARSYFTNTWQKAPPAARAALAGLAAGATPHLDAPTRRWLRRRGLLTESSELTIPIFGRWIREEEL